MVNVLTPVLITVLVFRATLLDKSYAIIASL